MSKAVLQFVITIMVYLRIAQQQNRFTNSFVEHFKENCENSNCIDFQFHNLKFSQERYFALSF